MTKKKWSLIFSIIGVICVSLFANACTLFNKSSQQVQCVKPEITVLDEGIDWARVENAKSYYYKYNSGKWIEAKEIIAFPTVEGEHTLQLKAVDTSGKDGKITKFTFMVEKLSVECKRVDNMLTFTGENICFSVNGMEESVLGEENILDFSNDTVGAEYTVQYYAKGGYFSQENNTYYIDSEKKSQEFIVGQMLAMPTLNVNTEGTGLTWSAAENALSYLVTVDGNPSTIETNNTSVAFPKTEGEHKITVQAIGNNTTWYSSLIAEYKMTTKRESVPVLTFDSRNNKVYWQETYKDKMQISTGSSAYTPLQATSVAVETGTTLKVGAHYSQTEKIYYLESKPIYFEKREVSLPSFSIDGYVDWNQDDTSSAKKYYVSVVEQTKTAEYTKLNENVKNISFLSAGAYTFSVYASDYVQETEEQVVFYLPSDTKQIDFAVLEKPALSFKKGKLLWEMDPLATGYEYRLDGAGEWKTATEEGMLSTWDMANYEVRALGSEEAGRYALSSEISTLFFDPELAVDWEHGKSDLALFNDMRYQQLVASANNSKATKTASVEVLTSVTADSPEKAILDGANGGVLKVTAGNASPLLKAYWGNSDGASIELLKPLPVVEDARITFRIYVVPNANRKTAFVYNYTGEYVNKKGRTIDANGNTYAYFDENNNLVGYQSETNKLIDAKGVEIGTINTKTYIATIAETGAVTKARIAYGVLDNNDTLLGVAGADGIVKNGDKVVGTLNNNGELVDASGNVLSTSAVRKTKNLEGQFILSVIGNKPDGGFREYNTWFDNETSAIKVGEWTEVSLPITKGHVSALLDIQSLHIHFLANAQQGDIFYIDEIRYDENALLVEAPTFLSDKGEVGPSYYSVREFADFKPSVTMGKDEYGEYIDFDWGDYQNGWGKDAITFYFNDAELKEGVNW